VFVTSGRISIGVFDIYGRKTNTLSENKFYQQGNQEIEFSDNKLLVGFYLILLKIDDISNVKKIIKAKSVGWQ
jgi:hypothetical protein